MGLVSIVFVVVEANNKDRKKWYCGGGTLTFRFSKLIFFLFFLEKSLITEGVNLEATVVGVVVLGYDRIKFNNSPASSSSELRSIYSKSYIGIFVNVRDWVKDDPPGCSPSSHPDS